MSESNVSATTSKQHRSVPLERIVFRQDLYPRFEHDPGLVQRYADNLDQLPPIEVNQHNELIDGWHRWTAHKKAQSTTIDVIVTETANESEFLALAIRRNARHGKQLGNRDKCKMAIRLYNGGEGVTDKKEIANILSVSVRMVTHYLKEVERQVREERRELVRKMWMACYTQEEIAKETGLLQQRVAEYMQELPDLELLPNPVRLAASYQDADWTPPLYDIWSFKDNANSTRHFGNTHQGIADHLLYTFTQPFDVVVDPFGGGGSTIDVCRRRLRRYWVSDRKPIPERPDIRQMELSSESIAGPSRWKDVALVYLDPPYWRQAENQYSCDPEDLGNMPLEQFTDTMVSIIAAYAKRLPSGSHIATIIQPTQWKADDRQTVYHDRDIDYALRKNRRLRLVRTALCPYSTQQYTPQMVKAAKRDKLWLVLSRTLLVWEVA